MFLTLQKPLVEDFEPTLKVDKAFQDLLTQGVLCYNSGQYRKAKDLFNEGYTTASKDASKIDPMISSIFMGNSAAALYCDGSIHEALDMNLKVLKNRRKNISIQPLSLAISLYNAAVIATEQSEYSKSLDHLNNALEFAEKAGNNNLKMAIFNLFSYNYIIKADLTKARTYAENSRGMILRKLCDNIFRVSETHNNLGMLYFEQGKFEESIDEFTRAKDILLTSVDSSHPDVLTIDTNLEIGRAHV